jgi:hypothetical protein
LLCGLPSHLVRISARRLSRMRLNQPCPLNHLGKQKGQSWGLERNQIAFYQRLTSICGALGSLDIISV